MQEVVTGVGARAAGVVERVVVGVVLSGGRVVGGEVAVVVGIGRVGRLGRRSYRQARALHMAKILLFSIASVHFGLNIPSGAKELGLVLSLLGPGRVKRMGRRLAVAVGGVLTQLWIEWRPGNVRKPCSAQRRKVGEDGLSGLGSIDGLACNVSGRWLFEGLGWPKRRPGCPLVLGGGGGWWVDGISQGSPFNVDWLAPGARILA